MRAFLLFGFSIYMLSGSAVATPGQALSQMTHNSPASQTYWQQKVDYELDVTLAIDGRTISGTEIVYYTNNSPDSLRVLFLKAFPNSARKGSLMDLRNRDGENYSIMRADPSQYGSLRIWNVHSRSGENIKAELDDTIYKLYLNRPIAPGATERISLEFETVLPAEIGDRHEYVAGQSKAAYWYPQVCVYDRGMGWVNAPYLGRGECYGDFGDYQVTITAPEDRIVVATGLLSNRKEVLPDSLREALDIENFYGPRDTWPEFISDSAKTKTWKFFAKNVNDFAWVAGSDFCMDDEMYNGVQLEVYPRRSRASGWKHALEYARRSLVTFSELYGDYRWPAIKVTDSFDGMEYPMITFCSGGDDVSATFSLLVYHEIAHFWFMGMLGSNQVDRACLDEGFTTMAEIIAMEKYHGRKGNNVRWDNHWYKKRFYPLDEDRDARGYRIYLEWARSGYDMPMIIHSDNASEYWAYRNSSYYKPVMMHFSLRSIFGDDLYFKAMRNYGNQWMFKHPYEGGFITSFSSSTGERLNNYFAQWFMSKKQIDYAYEGHKLIDGDDYEITVSKPGDFVSPIDVALINSSGDTVFYSVNPEGHHYLKPGYQDAGEWRQYRQPSREYTFTATVPGGLKRGVVDPYNLLADVNRLNNESGFLPPIETRLDAMFYDVPSMHKYSLRWRPDLWYDDPNGVILGLHTHGSYINTDHKFSLDLGVGTRSGRPQIDFKYSHPFRKIGKLAFFESRIMRTDIRTHAKIGVRKEYRPRFTGPDFLQLSASANFLNVDDKLGFARSNGFRLDDQLDLVNFGPWSDDSYRWLEFSARYGFETPGVRYYGSGISRTVYRPESGSTGSAHLRVANAIDADLVGPLHISFAQRVFWNWGRRRSPTGPLDFGPVRSTAFDEYANSRLFRSSGTIPYDWRGDVYLDDGGLRDGLAGFGTSRFGLQFSAVMGGWKPFNVHSVSRLGAPGRFVAGLNLELFGQIALLDDSFTTFQAGDLPSGEFDDIVAIAGASFVTPSIWNGQHARFDFPLYRTTGAVDEDAIDFRFAVAWILPINTEQWFSSLSRR